MSDNPEPTPEPTPQPAPEPAPTPTDDAAALAAREAKLKLDRAALEEEELTQRERALRKKRLDTEEAELESRRARLKGDMTNEQRSNDGGQPGAKSDKPVRKRGHWFWG